MINGSPLEGVVLAGHDLPEEEKALVGAVKVRNYVDTRAQRLLSKKKTIPADDREVIKDSNNIMGYNFGLLVEHILAIDSSYVRSRLLFILRDLIAATVRIAEQGAKNDALDGILKENAARPVVARQARSGTVAHRRGLIRPKVLKLHASRRNTKPASLATLLLDEVNKLLEITPAPRQSSRAKSEMMRAVSWDTLKGDIEAIIAAADQPPIQSPEQSADRK
jgi:hypothetical protein